MNSAPELRSLCLWTFAIDCVRASPRRELASRRPALGPR